LKTGGTAVSALLSVTGLRKSYGPMEVLKGIDFKVKAGEKIALIGPSAQGNPPICVA
jgi:polar amino acid transport system ATP-binding protein